MSEPNHNDEEDVMDLLSVSDNFDITREEENTLLGDESMAIDSPKKTTSATVLPKDRQPIVFDLGDSAADDDDDEDGGAQSDGQTRDKFQSERTIDYPLNDNRKRFITKGSDNGYHSETGFKRHKNSDPITRNRSHRSRGKSSGRQRRLNRANHSGPDLRQMINNIKNLAAYDQPINPFLSNTSRGLTPTLEYQLNVGLLRPSAPMARNQWLANALLAQGLANNHLGGRLSTPDTSVVNKVRKNDIQITVINDSVGTGSNDTKTKTRPSIRCRVMPTVADTTDPTNCQIIDNIPKAQTSQKPKLSTLFSRHLAAKANQNKVADQVTSASTGGLFGDALAEVEVGVDNDYLRRMQEQDQRRHEIQKHKEQRRMEMADERLESALKLKQKIGNQNSY